jgi:hypothetical protein
MDYTTRRLPLKRARRIAINVTVDPETHVILHRIGEGNRSAGLEEVVRFYLSKCRQPERNRLLEPIAE